jgi:hypothetical protein
MISKNNIKFLVDTNENINKISNLEFKNWK